MFVIKISDDDVRQLEIIKWQTKSRQIVLNGRDA